jgi:Tfp pilus assembly protein PilF
MTVSNASESRLALWTGAAGIVLGGILVGALVVGATSLARRGRAAAPGAAPDVLAPGAEAVRYRYAIGAAAPADAGDEIAALEARVAAQPSPFDDAALGELYLRRAQRSGDADDYQRARASAERSLAALASPNPAVLTLAKLAEVRHDFRAAIELAHRHKARSAGAQIVIATAELALGELAAAGDAAQAALAIKPDTAGHLMRALVMQAQGRDAEAAHDFAAATRLEEPGDVSGAARLRALWARFLLRRGERSGAARAIDEALRIAPGDPLATAMRGELALRSGRAGDAARLFDQAFAASRQIRYLIDEARAEELAGHAAAADELRDQVEHIVRSELATGGLGHRLDLAEVLADRGGAARIAEAVELGRAEALRRTSFEARFQLARALARSGATDEAARLVDAALAAGAREAQLYELAARLAASRGDASAAALYTRLADRIDPGASGWRRLGLELPR